MMGVQKYKKIYISYALGSVEIWLLSFFMLSVTPGCTSYEVVIDELSQREANEVLVLFRDHKIDAKKSGKLSKKSTLYHVLVKKAQSEVALKLLVHNQLPKVHRAGLKEVYPPGSSGIIPTKTDELARMIMAIQGEIEALLKIIPGVFDARVLISYEPPVDYHKTIIKKTASVALLYSFKPAADERPLSDSEIKSLIATSVSGLDASDVTVVQKMVSPIDSLVGESTTLTVDVKEIPSLNSPWYLMALTAMALIIAAYAIIRIFLQRGFLSGRLR